MDRRRRQRRWWVRLSSAVQNIVGESGLATLLGRGPDLAQFFTWFAGVGRVNQHLQIIAMPIFVQCLRLRLLWYPRSHETASGIDATMTKEHNQNKKYNHEQRMLSLALTGMQQQSRHSTTGTAEQSTFTIVHSA